MFATTLSSVALMVARALEGAGCDSRELFRRAGLEPGLLRDPGARYPYAGMTRLWELAVETTGDECFGLRIPRYWYPTTFHALGYSWLASNTLVEAMERLARYIRLISTASEPRLEREAEGYALYFDSVPGLPQAALAARDATAALLVHMLRSSYGDELAPLRLELPRPVPGCRSDFEDYFRCPIIYDAPQIGLVVPRRAAEASLPTANAELAHANDRIIADYLAHLDRHSVSVRVKAQLLDRLPSGDVSESAMAELLHTSPRSLQRRLGEEETSFSRLLEETRRELAERYLQNSRLSIGEITFLLGFSEQSNFARAFRRWHGVSPSVYRQARLGQAGDLASAS